MRFSLVILACLATAFGAKLEEMTNAPTSTSKVEDGNDQDPASVDFDEGVGDESFQDSETNDEDNELNIIDEGDSEGEEEDEGDDAGANELETNPAEDENIQNEEETGDEELSIAKPSDDVGVAVPPLPEEEENNDNNELDFSGNDSESEFGDNLPDETEEGVNGNEGQGGDIPDSQDNDLFPDDEGSDVQEEEESTRSPSTENPGSDESDVEDEDKTFPSFSTENPGSDEFDMTPTPVDSFTPYPMAYNPPTLRPAVPYVSTDDDPLKSTDGFASTIEDWFTNESTIEEMEHDRNVIIALSVVFGFMFFFSVFVAYQMLENPDGCCASLCRITVACWCGIIRCICYPCRSICGCTGGSEAQHMMVPDDGQFTHDLELS
mmetsp:Transcript_21620/g.51577  ORF Transcript_21620/g.51577 Transcript_21620/m.51577 type:complete len:379 (+) Transcript_21620:151-1287(+)